MADRTKIAGIGWYTRENYAAAREIMADKKSFPVDYDEWQKEQIHEYEPTKPMGFASSKPISRPTNSVLGAERVDWPSMPGHVYGLPLSQLAFPWTANAAMKQSITLLQQPHNHPGARSDGGTVESNRTALDQRREAKPVKRTISERYTRYSRSI